MTVNAAKIAALPAPGSPCSSNSLQPTQDGAFPNTINATPPLAWIQSSAEGHEPSCKLNLACSPHF
jgi:hypothetical protein